MACPTRMCYCHKTMFMRCCGLWLVGIYLTASAFAQAPRKSPFLPNRYTLILADPPVAQRFAGRERVRSAAAAAYRGQVESTQATLRRELASRNIRVEGSVSTVLNALFVAAPAARVPELRSLPGVRAVLPRRILSLHTNRATALMNAPAAWSALGGQSMAGAGIKIAIIDTGIDQNHPAFQDSSLSVPAGFPKCNAPTDCIQFTNNKVIVARSYVPLFAAGSDPNNPAADSTPDDLSAQDHVGHGTAVASIAAGNTNTGSVTFSGMAPKAWLGSYKVSGSPGVHDGIDGAASIMAIEDALNDGMDVAVYSAGGPAFSGPLDTGAICGQSTGTPCDPMAAAFESAARAGLVIVASAGNDGDGTGQAYCTGANVYPCPTVVSSPSTAPSVLSAGALLNSHVMLPTVSLAGNGAPSNLKNIAAVNSDADDYFSIATIAPLVDVTQLGDNGFACYTLPDSSLYNSIALIAQGGTCQDGDRALNAWNAGAIGIILYAPASATTLSPPEGIQDNFFGPVVLVSNSDGLNLKTYIGANPGQTVTVDLAGAEQDLSAYVSQWNLTPAVAANQFASYSSIGPSLGNYAIKPDLAATGGLDPGAFSLGLLLPDPTDYYLPLPSGMYIAAQTFDPYGEVYSQSGYAAADGTSLAAPLIAGAAAMVKQAHPGWTAAQIRSALVNNSAQDVKTDDFLDPIDAEWIGAGRLDAGGAVAATVTVEPSSLSFGAWKTGGSLPAAIPLTIVNHGSSAVSLTPAAAPATAVSGISVSLSPAGALLLPAGGSAVLNVSLTGSIPSAGEYSGNVTLQGSGVSLHIPYMFIVGNGMPYNITYAFIGGDVIAGQDAGVQTVAVTDSYGIAVPNASVVYSISPRGSATLSSVPGAPACSPSTSATTITCPTDNNGFSWVDVTTGPNPNVLSLNVTAVGQRFYNYITARSAPTIAAGGVQPWAYADAGTPVAPGSYAAITGAGLADSDIQYGNAPPYAMFLECTDAGGVCNVSFDVPSAGLSLPARIISVSPTEIDVQVPWELKGQSSAQVKVIMNGYEFSNVITVPLADYSPAFLNAAADAIDASGKTISATNPAKQGQNIQLIVSGLGPVTNNPGDGNPAGSNAATLQQPQVVIGGQNAAVSASQLRPGSAGNYLVTVTVPTGLTPGPSVPIAISIAGVGSKPAVIPVQ